MNESFSSNNHEAPLVVIAIGGKSLIKDSKHRSVMVQYKAVGETASHIVPFVREGYRVVVTGVLVDEDDPGFKHPDKPIGLFLTEKVAKEHASKDGWVVGEDAGRGWCRLVPAPVRCAHRTVMEFAICI